MTTIAATDQRVLEAGARVVARHRRVATVVAAVFFAIGWLAAWLAPPVVVALVRVCRRALGWCAAAVALGWADARGRAASGGGASGA